MPLFRSRYTEKGLERLKWIYDKHALHGLIKTCLYSETMFLSLFSERKSIRACNEADLHESVQAFQDYLPHLFLRRNILFLRKSKEAALRTDHGELELNKVLVVVSILALILGISVGTPFLLQNISLGEHPKVYDEVVYASFQFQDYNSNVIGRQGDKWLTYVLVLNVTNLSNRLVMVNDFEVIAAQQIEFLQSRNVTNVIFNGYPNASTSSVGTQVSYNMSIGIGAENPVSRSENFPPGNEYYWDANESRLVAFTGSLSVSSFVFGEYEGGSISVFSHVSGQVVDSQQYVSGAYVIKRIDLQLSQNSTYVYNSLLDPNEFLWISNDGTGVSIVQGN